MIVTLLLVSLNVFASEQKANSAVAEKAPCASGCGPIEHLLGKAIVRKYVKENPTSGLVANYDDEGVKPSIVKAVRKFGKSIKLVDKDGMDIMPQPFKDTATIVLPMYLCPEFMLKKMVLSTADINSTLSTRMLVKQWSEQFKHIKATSNLSAKELYELNKAQDVWAQTFVGTDGITICGTCNEPQQEKIRK